MKNLRLGIYHLTLILITISSIVFVLLSQKINFNTNPIRIYQHFYTSETYRLKQNQKQDIFQLITCLTGTKRVSTLSQCIKTSDNSTIYVPFEALRKKFDINGRLDSDNNFRIQFSDSKIFYPTEKYNPKDEYLWFKDLNVESRERVKMVSLRENIPISLQWNKSGHFYPIQICQFGLSHFSKWSHENKMSTRKKISKPFMISQNDRFVYSENEMAFVKPLENGFEFRFPERSIYKSNYSFDIRYITSEIMTNSIFNLTIDLMLRDSSIQSGSHIIHLVYTFNSLNKTQTETFETSINSDKSYLIVYQITGLEKPLKFIRNFCIDSCKALKIKCENCLKLLNETMLIINDTSNSHLYRSQYYKVYQIGLSGEGKILNGVLSEQSPDFEMAKTAGDYLVSSQNLQTGGWMVNITRKFVSNSKKIMLHSGWYSSMAQGHAISLLCRLYLHTKDIKYYETAAKALNLYEIDSSQNGIRANFMNSSFVWYEEYPTRPNSLFVLNGFVFSLYGLNDFINGCQNFQDKFYYSKAKELFLKGLDSLVNLINFYDTGTRTFYDLGHLSDSDINPNIARWDYHSLHVSQLNYLVNILENLDNNFDRELVTKYAKKLKVVAERWDNYMNGIWYRNSQIKD